MATQFDERVTAAPAPSPGRPSTADASTAELVSKMSDQVSRLIRDEIKLAKIELTEKGKKAGIGAGMFGGAGIVALYGLGALIAAGVLALALVMPAWAAALIAAVVLFAVAGVLALTGKSQVSKVGSPMPTEAIGGVKQDVAAVKERVHP